ncbi:hypothetical protein CCP3SC15_190016 [Gammaproteobacteria bacterium]
MPEGIGTKFSRSKWNGEKDAEESRSTNWAGWRDIALMDESAVTG